MDWSVIYELAVLVTLLAVGYRLVPPTINAIKKQFKLKGNSVRALVVFISVLVTLAVMVVDGTIGPSVYVEGQIVSLVFNVLMASQVRYKEYETQILIDEMNSKIKEPPILDTFGDS